MSEKIEGARKLIAARLGEIETEKTRLERALTSMIGDARSRPREKARGKRPRRKRRSLAPRGQRRKQLLEAVKANPGARPVELANAIGISPSHAHALIGQARAERLIVKKGAGYALKK
jgi:hypothetical protein